MKYLTLSIWSKATSSNWTVPCLDYIVKLRIYLQNIEEAVRLVNGLEHLHLPHRVNFLVSKFYSQTLHDWDYFKSKSSVSAYARFYKFLIDRYDACRSSIDRQKRLIFSQDGVKKHPGAQSGKINKTKATLQDECQWCQKWTLKEKLQIFPACGRETDVGEKIHHCLEHCGLYI